MPETMFRLRWPDDRVTENYSPSSIIREHFAAGASYRIADFLPRARAAMSAASERVRQAYGYPCSRAGATLARIEAEAANFATQPDSSVTILELF